jgi:anti-sigma regulatory factor (Ser/Thr protein kinase)
VGTFWVRHASTSASVVRRSVCAALCQAGASEDEALDAALIASELVGNAVRHAAALPSGHLAVEWRIEDGPSYLIAVTDGGGVHPVSIKQADVCDTSGRGLAIVAAVADDWGVSVDEGSTTVWARRKFTAPLQVTADGALCCAN